MDGSSSPPLNYTSPRIQREVFRSHLLLSDQEILDLGIRPCDVELYRRRHYQASFSINTWYDALREHTFRTETVDLSFEEAQSIVTVFLSKRQAGVDLSKERDILQKLAVRLDWIIKNDFNRRCFIKLNTRSPKDAPIYDFNSQTVKKAIISEISRLEPQERDDNNETIAFVKATNRCLVTSSGIEAVQVLTRSMRIYEDLIKCIQFGEKHFEAKLVIREWLEEVINKPEMEFRCFVCKNQMNAITQYFSMCHFPDLAPRKEEIQKKILHFFDTQLKNKLTHNNYVVDLFIGRDRILIIELNPFHNGAGAGLFSWATDRDTLMNGPLEFKILLQPAHNVREHVPDQWQRLISSEFHNSEDEDDEDPDIDEPVAYWPWTLAAVMVVGSVITGRLTSRFEI
ncbi:hypothetical protein PROFUN_13825 [Planoprotostelium fungivorum]|uniref:Cell division cycle protein 123 n=1 Tax=Planoprotostelium fungivorum TaxID=1890364 RepID=A0A2P6N2W8_9EUKA|nr:hypothetical protein PROFUN_13825 [Planoprotostelium fungivorum]